MKFLWRAAVRGISRPIYIVAQNVQSANAAASSHPEVALEDVTFLQRIDEWNEQQGRTEVNWPEPPPEPQPDPWPPL